ncbi:hypothetical protein B0H13DRAFT_1884774 [Mycena leptocephala]|nr:hypothetical protein B0H13DRAFT_1884774 [Mycena leptocephala]
MFPFGKRACCPPPRAGRRHTLILHYKPGKARKYTGSPGVEDTSKGQRCELARARLYKEHSQGEFEKRIERGWLWGTAKDPQGRGIPPKVRGLEVPKVVKLCDLLLRSSLKRDCLDCKQQKWRRTFQGRPLKVGRQVLEVYLQGLGEVLEVEVEVSPTVPLPLPLGNLRDSAKADQIPFHIYTKLFHVLYAARASEQAPGPAQGKTDKWFNLETARLLSRPICFTASTANGACGADTPRGAPARRRDGAGAQGERGKGRAGAALTCFASRCIRKWQVRSPTSCRWHHVAPPLFNHVPGLRRLRHRRRCTAQYPLYNLFY